MWPSFTERADREGWPAARLLATLAELELAERAQRRIQRHPIEARLLPGKTLDSTDFAAVPMLSRAHVAALATGDGWIDRGGTILLFGPSGSGKSHLSAAFGHALIESGYRVLFTRTRPISCSVCNKLGRPCRWCAIEALTNTTCSSSKTSAVNQTYPIQGNVKRHVAAKDNHGISVPVPHVPGEPWLPQGSAPACHTAVVPPSHRLKRTGARNSSAAHVAAASWVQVPRYPLSHGPTWTSH